MFHGSRYAASAMAASHLAQLLSQKLPNPLVTTAALELAALPLHQNIIDFAQFAIADGYQKIQILPLFLSQGVHVREDLPAEIAQAQEQLGTTINLELLTELGGYPEIASLLAKQFTQIAPPTATRILLAHGSRLAGGNRPYEALAAKLDAVNAYWSVPPDLSKTVRASISKNTDTIVIILYFLFPGKITQAIADQVKQLQVEFPRVNLMITPPLAATPELAEIISYQLMVSG